MSDRHESWSRREFVTGLTLAGTAGLLGVRPGVAAAEPPPETTSIRLAQPPGICVAPQSVADALLQGEGFTQTQYVRIAGSGHDALASGEADIGMSMVGPLLIKMEAGAQVVVLAGGHIGCLELIATDRIHTLRDLKGKTVAVRSLGSTEHVFIASMLAYVGLNPRDVTWVFHPQAESIRLLVEKKVDALMAFPPQAQELRADKIGRVIVNGTLDRPWSQYFCCMVSATREFVRKHPAATKRALRAILKSADLCSFEPERVARSLVDKGFTKSYDYALQTMKELPYGKWREYDPEDPCGSMRSVSTRRG